MLIQRSVCALLFLTAMIVITETLMSGAGAPEQQQGAISTDMTAEELIARTHRALGGADRLARVRAFSLEVGPEVIRILLPDRYQSINQTDRGKSVITLDRDRVWSVSPKWPASIAAAPTSRLSEAERAKNLQRQITRFSLMYLVRAPRPNLMTVTSVGRVKYGSVQGDGVEFRTKGEDDWLRVIVSPETARPLALVRPLRTSPAGPAAGEAVTVLEDYREADGILVPFRLIEQRVNQPGTADRTMRRFQYTAIRVNPPLTASDFAQPTNGSGPRK
jgi:hypothetical protein